MESFSTQSSYQRDARNPLKSNALKGNETSLKQITTGSILGLVGGVVVSFFSKPLALLIGLLVIGVQVRLYTEISKGVV
jgi:uncharacterized membrane protein (Fun14 family)